MELRASRGRARCCRRGRRCDQAVVADAVEASLHFAGRAPRKRCSKAPAETREAAAQRSLHKFRLCAPTKSDFETMLDEVARRNVRIPPVDLIEDAGRQQIFPFKRAIELRISMS